MGQLKNLGLTLLVAFLLLGFPSTAAPVYLGADSVVVTLAGGVMVLRDDGGRMDFAEVTSQAIAGRFVPAPADLRFGTTDGAIWLRFDVVRDAAAADHWLFEVVAPQLDYVALYDSDGRARHAGDHLPIAGNDVDYRVPVFSLSLPAQEPVTYYLRLAGSEPITVPLFLWRPIAFFETRLGESMVYGAFYGLIGVMTAYGLCLALMIRDRLYAAFALDIVATALLIAALSGHVHQLGLSQHPLFADRFTGMAVIVQALAGMIFVSLLLDVRRALPRLSRSMQGLAVLAVLLAIAWWTPLSPWLCGVSWAVATAAAALGLAAAALLARRGDRAARIYLAAYVAQTAGAAVHFSQLAGLLPQRGLLSHAFMGGSAIAVVLFSLAVSDRIRRLHAELIERRLAEARLRDLALSDPLTGLANRAQLDQRLAQALERQAGGGEGFAVILVDLDRFKEINDRLGHAAGDELLRQLAWRMRLAMRSGDCAARLGGDEFVLLAEGVSGREAAGFVAAKVAAALREPVQLEAGQVAVGGSVGIALCPEHGRTADALLAAADAAMYAAKRSGGAGWAFAVS